MRQTFLERSVGEYTGDGSSIVSVREARDETVLLLRQTWLGQAVYHRLVTNGFSMSCAHTRLACVHALVCVLADALAPGVPLTRALVMCYGVGVTTGAVIDNDELTSIDVVEISPGRRGDERSHLSAEAPSAPRSARAAPSRGLRASSLNGPTQIRPDYRRAAAARSRQGPSISTRVNTSTWFTNAWWKAGIVSYWLPIAGDGAYDVAPIVRAFCEVFEDCSLWNGTPLRLDAGRNPTCAWPSLGGIVRREVAESRARRAARRSRVSSCRSRSGRRFLVMLGTYDS